MLQLYNSKLSGGPMLQLYNSKPKWGGKRINNSRHCTVLQMWRGSIAKPGYEDMRPCLPVGSCTFYQGPLGL